MLEDGYIKVYRSILKWEWYDDINTFRVFIHLLLTVSHYDNEWHGKSVKRGQRICSYAKLASETNLSVQNVRTAIKHLISTGELTYKPNRDYGLIAVNNYDKFQRLTHEVTNDQQTSNTPLTDLQHTSNNRVRKSRKQESNNTLDISADAPPVKKTKRFEKPTVEEIKTYCTERGNNIDAQYFFDHYEANGWIAGKVPMKDWKATVRTWEKRDAEYGGSKKKTKPERDTSFDLDEYGDAVNNFTPVYKKKEG